MAKPVRVVVEWQDDRLVCALGHTYRGRVRMISQLRYDMDGESFWSEPFAEYEPARCVVCGLVTWRREQPQREGR